MEEEEKRFSEGDTVTYLARKDSRIRGYAFGGEETGGKTGTVTTYDFYSKDHKCWRIQVTHPDGGNYTMLEKEFEEYYQLPTAEPVQIKAFYETDELSEKDQDYIQRNT